MATSELDKTNLYYALSYAVPNKLSTELVPEVGAGIYTARGWNPTAQARINDVDPIVFSIMKKIQARTYDEFTPDELEAVADAFERSIAGFEIPEPRGRVSFFNRAPLNARRIDDAQERLDNIKGALEWTTNRQAELRQAELDPARPELTAIETPAAAPTHPAELGQDIDLG